MPAHNRGTGCRNILHDRAFAARNEQKGSRGNDGDTNCDRDVMALAFGPERV